MVKFRIWNEILPWSTPIDSVTTPGENLIIAFEGHWKRRLWNGQLFFDVIPTDYAMIKS